MITGIAHGAYFVGDIRATEDFYVGKLGLKRAFSMEDDEGNLRLLYVNIPGTMQFLEFFPAKDAKNPVEGSFYAHLCLAVQDAAEAQRQMIAKGVEITVPLKMGGDGNWQFWTKDPDGNPIEFMQMMPGSKQQQAVQGDR